MKWKPSYFTREQMEERRREGGRLLQEGKISKAEIARQLGVSRASVTAWAKVLDKKGMRGLNSKKAVGRASKLNDEQKKKLKRLLKQGATKSGYLTERWTLERVSELIEKEFGITYHPKGLGRVLEKLGFSLQKPLARADERDEELVKAWLLQDWSRIKKGLAARRSHRISG
jgi:transposase